MEAMEGFTGLQNTAVLLNEMFFQHKLVEQMLAIDNSAAIVIAHGEGGSWRTRHLRVRAAVLRDRIERKELQVTHAPGDVQLADQTRVAKRRATTRESFQKPIVSRSSYSRRKAGKMVT